MSDVIWKAQSPDSGYRCDRPWGHDGAHAWSSGSAFEIWDANRKPHVPGTGGENDDD